MDMQMYGNLLDAAFTLLKNNSRNIDQNFAETFMRNHDPRNGPQVEQYANAMWNYCLRAARHMNGEEAFRNQDQLFDAVGGYIKEILQQLASQQNRGSSFGGFGSQSGGSGFGGGNMFGSGNRGGGFGFNQQPVRPMGGSHLDDTPQTRQQPPQQQQQSPQPTTGSLSFTSPVVAEPAQIFSLNPLDEFPDQQNMDFSSSQSRTSWGESPLKDRRIVLSGRTDYKTRDPRFMVAGFDAHHQLILNDPLDAVKDFFEVVPDHTLAKTFIARIYYQHLTTIEVPTKDFKDIRDKCIAAIKQDSSTPLWRKIIESMNTMARGPYKALETYLVDHINRALHLACRITSNPTAYVKITEIDDLSTILTSSWHNELVSHPDGRHRLEKIVGSALWNALAMNSSLMFIDGPTPTHAIQSSPAFPFSMKGVYPNKFSIPTGHDGQEHDFHQRLEEHQLQYRSFILSRRSVVVTNILGKHVLPKLSKEPQIFNNTVAALLTKYALPFSRFTIEARDLNSGEVKPNVLETHQSEQLTAYYENEFTEQDEMEIYERKEPPKFPVDQIFFAFQYGESPLEYLASFDVLTTTDDQMSSSQVMLAKKHVSVLKPTV